VETGKTMKLAINYLKIKGAEKIYTSSLFYKKNLICKPDFFNLKTKSWIVFHFDIMETVKFLGSRWLSKNQSLKEIKNNFLKIGLPENEVAKAMQLIFNFS
jgi:hypoxanthine phosphoribosyltransferase